jgi:hypothetical protein
MRLRTVLCLFGAAVLLVSNAGAVVISANIAGLGTVYQDAAGNLFSAAAPGRTDVTAAFLSDITVANTYLQNSIGVAWNETITYSLFNFGDANTIADAGVTNTDTNGRPSAAAIRFNDFTGVPYFIDATPFDNSEFTIANGTANLGGGTVNNQRLGNATGTGGAAARWDLLTLVLHEDEHALGISSGLARFTNLAGATGGTGRVLAIPNTLSGLTNAFNIPITQNSAHYNGGCTVAVPPSSDCTANDAATGSATFNLSVVSQPGWGTGQRALPTALDILGICQVEGCTAAQVNTNLISPEPMSLSLLAGGLALLALRRRRRQRG